MQSKANIFKASRMKKVKKHTMTHKVCQCKKYDKEHMSLTNKSIKLREPPMQISG